MAKTKKMDARRRARDAQDKGLQGVVRTPTAATKTKSELRRAFVATKAADVVARNLADDSGARCTRSGVAHAMATHVADPPPSHPFVPIRHVRHNRC
jgi:hypothetical protein